LHERLSIGVVGVSKLRIKTVGHAVQEVAWDKEKDDEKKVKAWRV
jgi:hypothetical protein